MFTIQHIKNSTLNHPPSPAYVMLSEALVNLGWWRGGAEVLRESGGVAGAVIGQGGAATFRGHLVLVLAVQVLQVLLLQLHVRDGRKHGSGSKIFDMKKECSKQVKRPVQDHRSNTENSHLDHIQST
jgi:hypothetical protein